jgi:sugar phosphate isomerase/epimerase
MADPRFCIGNQTAYFVPPLQPFSFAVEHGFEAFELFPDTGPDQRGWCAEDLDAQARATMGAAAQQHNMRLSVHATLTADLHTPVGRHRLLRDLDLAHDVGARVLVTHLEPRDPQLVVNDLLDLAGILHRLGVTLALENTIAASPESFNQLFARLPAGPFAMCLDIGHANLHAGTRNDYLGYLDRLDRDIPIAHIHAHENRGDADTHLALFTGPARENPAGLQGLVNRLHDRGFSGSVIFEQWPNPPELLIAARERLRALIDRAASR